jgi:hypothetical protein
VSPTHLLYPTKWQLHLPRIQVLYLHLNREPEMNDKKEARAQRYFSYRLEKPDMARVFRKATSILFFLHSTPNKH